jgi:hypothetical protein
MSKLRRLIVSVLSEGPMTDVDLVEILKPRGFSPSGIRTRRSELVRLGKVVDTKKRAVLASGRKATLWGLPS